jgi:hypothetical protein
MRRAFTSTSPTRSAVASPKRKPQYPSTRTRVRSRPAQSAAHPVHGAGAAGTRRAPVCFTLCPHCVVGSGGDLIPLGALDTGAGTVGSKQAPDRPGFPSLMGGRSAMSSLGRQADQRQRRPENTRQGNHRAISPLRTVGIPHTRCRWFAPRSHDSSHRWSGNCPRKWWRVTRDDVVEQTVSPVVDRLARGRR